MNNNSSEIREISTYQTRAESIQPEASEESNMKLWHIFVLYIVSGVIENAYINQKIKESKSVLAEIFNQPISESLFGQSKTYRGIAAIPAFNFLLSTLLCRPFFGWTWNETASIGYIGRIMWSLGELPNSLMKRVLQIPPGTCGSSLQWLIDHADSSCGLIAYLCLAHGWNLTQTLPFLPFSIGAHACVAMAKQFSSSSSSTSASHVSLKPV